jgi:uncharacterized repeat protein (TIGR03803 family)
LVGPIHFGLEIVVGLIKAFQRRFRKGRTDATTLYGATALGGEAGVGTLYALPVAGGLKYRYSFHGKTGDNPHGRPVSTCGQLP